MEMIKQAMHYGVGLVASSVVACHPKRSHWPHPISSLDIQICLDYGQMKSFLHHRQLISYFSLPGSAADVAPRVSSIGVVTHPRASSNASGPLNSQSNFTRVSLLGLHKVLHWLVFPLRHFISVIMVFFIELLSKVVFQVAWLKWPYRSLSIELLTVGFF